MTEKKMTEKKMTEREVLEAIWNKLTENPYTWKEKDFPKDNPYMVLERFKLMVNCVIEERSKMAKIINEEREHRSDLCLSARKGISVLQGAIKKSEPLCDEISEHMDQISSMVACLKPFPVKINLNLRDGEVILKTDPDNT